MAGIDFNLSLYKAPSNEILRHRKEFYGLWKRCDDETKTWLNRVQSKIYSCDFPPVMSREYLLIDKFVCKLDEDEREFIQSVNTWTLWEFLEYFEHRKVDTDATNSNISIDDHPVMPPVVAVKCEIVAGNKYSEKMLGNEFADEESSMVKPSINYGVKEEDGGEDDPLMTDAQQFEPKPDGTIEMTVDVLKTEFENYEYSTINTPIVAEIGNDRNENIVDSSNKHQSTATLTTTKRYACDQCEKSFTRSWLLKRHKREVHQPVRPHACQLCNKRFANHHYLKKHLNWHNGERPYKCDPCSISYTHLWLLKRHEREVHHRILPHACQLCDKRFFSSFKLKVHLNAHNGERPYKCDQCSISFTDPSNLGHHKRRIHQALGPRSKLLVEHSEVLLLPYQCDYCNERFHSNTDLDRHSLTHAGPSLDTVNHLVKPSVIYGVKKKREENDPLMIDAQQFEPNPDGTIEMSIDVMKTEFENYEYSTIDDTPIAAKIGNDNDENVVDSSNNEQSTDTLTTAKRYACDQCDKSFSKLYLLNRHKNGVHQRIRPHACHLCDKRFANSSKLRAHLNVHNGERPYKCDQCSKSFAAPSNLIQHKRRIHRVSGPRAKHLVEHSEVLLPYQCDYCNERFHSNADLDRHSLTHAGLNSVKFNQIGNDNDFKYEFENYECSIMNSRTAAKIRNDNDENVVDSSNQEQSTATLTTTKRYACDQCSKSFSRLDALKRHKIALHQRIRPYACQLCDKRFVTAFGLKIHLNRHNGERPYKCDQCSKSFAAPNNLIQHKRIHRVSGPRAKHLVEHSEALLSYQCDYCNQRFHSNTDLDRHSLTHAGPSLDTVNHLQISDLKCEFENYEYSTVDTVVPAEFSNDTE